MPDRPHADLVALRARRGDRLATLLRELDLDHVLLSGADHIRYATDYRTQLVSEAFDWYAAIVDADGEAEVFVPYVEDELPRPDEGLPHVRAVHPLPSWAPAACHPRQWLTAVGGVLARRGARRVGYEGLDVVLRDGLAERGLLLRPVGRELFQMREIKDEIEVELLAATCRANEAALRRAVETAGAGMSDHDLLAVAAHDQHAAGVEFLTHGVCNVRKSSGGWFADGARLREGEPFFLDIGCYGRGGYASDLCRTGFVGDVPDAVRHAYACLLEAHLAGQDSARPGVRASAVHEAINACLHGHRLPHTPYATGHGVGLRICELPTIYRRDRMDEDAVIRAGQVLAIEPETTVEVNGLPLVLKVEDNFLVEPSGLRPLSATAPALS
ncbi:M24 family metallopeptidase [Actinomadura sp. ATCC 31491]|uniref:M24 family metallopeptidase n=1 Tax=Actinomadura luzonensis TaxID=2805427 RepID=A0ABT0G0W2_9ACTN|nr:M24 family metallopeptidase [Actinomadura luzonensis]MCK2218200.1 M24 family metallopeptidase [Actinomadura luzonensis]